MSKRKGGNGTITDETIIRITIIFTNIYLAISSQIVDMNREKILTAEKEDREVKKEELINLKKIAIGNGLTDIATQTPYYYDL